MLSGTNCFGRNLHSVGCATQCSKSEVMLTYLYDVIKCITNGASKFSIKKVFGADWVSVHYSRCTPLQCALTIYFRRWIYDHVNTGIIGLYVHVHSNGTRTFPRDVKVPSMYYVGTFLDPHPPTLCKQNVVSMQNKPFFDPPCFLQVTILELWRLCVPHLAQTSFLQKVFCRVGTVSSKIMTFVHTFKVNFLCQKTSESFLFFYWRKSIFF